MGNEAKKFEFEEGNYKQEKAEVVGEIEKFVGDWEKLSGEEIMEEKMEFVENYFRVEMVDYLENGGSPRHGKTFDFTRVASTELSKRAIRGLWGRFAHLFEERGEGYEGFISECMTAVVTLTVQFKESQDTYDYSKMNDAGEWNKEKDKYIVWPSREFTSLHAYIAKVSEKTKISALESEIMKYTQFINWQKRSGNGIDELPVDYFDGTVEVDGEEMNKYELIAEADSIFHNHVGNVGEEFNSDKIVYRSSYQHPHFVIWFKDWMEKQKRLRSNPSPSIRATAAMTSEQLIYYSKIKDVYRGVLLGETPYTKNFEDRHGVEHEPSWVADYNKDYNAQDRYYYNKAIEKAALKAYAEEFPAEKGFLQMRHEVEKPVLDEIMEIINTDKFTIESMNERLSRWISTNLKNDVVRRVVDSMDIEDQMEIERGKKSRNKMMDSEVLYRFVEVIEDNLDVIFKYEETGYKVVEFYKNDEEFIEGSKEKAMEAKRKRDDKRKAIKQPDMYVYKKGELLEVVAWEDLPKKKEVNVRRTQPNGNIAMVDLNDDDYY